MLGGEQLAAQTVLRSPPPLDSARASLRDAVLVLRDSLVTVDGAAARLQRDYREASGPSLLSRAQQMYEACARSGRTVPQARLAVKRTEVNRITHFNVLIRPLNPINLLLHRLMREELAKP